MQETGFLYFLFFSIQSPFSTPAAIFVEASPCMLKIIFFSFSLFSEVFLTQGVIKWDTVEKITIEILSSEPRIFIKYRSESFTKSIFLPIILPLTSTTQHKSIGGLPPFEDVFVLIYRATGRIYSIRPFLTSRYRAINLNSSNPNFYSKSSFSSEDWKSIIGSSYSNMSFSLRLILTSSIEIGNKKK